MLRLLTNWRDVLRRAWSVRFIVLAALFSGAEMALPVLEDLLPISRGVFAALASIASGAAFIARHVAQENLSSEEKDK